MTRRVNTYSNLYISDMANIKPKYLQKINKNINHAYEIMDIDYLERPVIVIVNTKEINGNVGLYSAINNTLYISDDVLFLKGDNSFADYHEMWHTKQANDYIKAGNVITASTYKDYLEQLKIISKNKIDKLGIDEYNVSEISEYARKSYFYGKYDEVEAEFMIKKLSEEGKIK